MKLSSLFVLLLSHLIVIAKSSQDPSQGVPKDLSIKDNGDDFGGLHELDVLGDQSPDVPQALSIEEDFEGKEMMELRELRRGGKKSRWSNRRSSRWSTKSSKSKRWNNNWWHGGGRWPSKSSKSKKWNNHHWGWKYDDDDDWYGHQWGGRWSNGKWRNKNLFD